MSILVYDSERQMISIHYTLIIYAPLNIMTKKYCIINVLFFRWYFKFLLSQQKKIK